MRAFFTPNSPKKHLLALLILILGTLGAQGQEETFFSISSRVLVGGETREDLVRVTDEMGGFFIVNSSEYLNLRIPVGEIQGFQEILEELSQRVLSYEMSSSSTRQQRRSTLAAIASREERLARNREYLDRTNVQGTLALEQEILNILSELEYYKGQLQVLEHRNRYAEVWVFFTMPQPVTPSTATSSFEWLARLNFYQFIEGGME